MIDEGMPEEAKDIIITSMEIALMVLSGSLGDDVRERALNDLDVSDVEADVLEGHLEIIMEANEVEYV